MKTFKALLLLPLFAAIAHANMWTAADSAGKVNRNADLAAYDPLVARYLTTAADSRTELGGMLRSAISRTNYYGKIMEEGVVAVVSATEVRCVRVSGGMRSGVIIAADVLDAANRLREGMHGNVRVFFYHDHTSSGGPLSDGDIEYGWTDNIVTIAKTGDHLGMMIPGGARNGNPVLRLYELSAKALVG